MHGVHICRICGVEDACDGHIMCSRCTSVYYQAYSMGEGINVMRDALDEMMAAVAAYKRDTSYLRYFVCSMSLDH